MVSVKYIFVLIAILFFIGFVPTDVEAVRPLRPLRPVRPSRLSGQRKIHPQQARRGRPKLHNGRIDEDIQDIQNYAL